MNNLHPDQAAAALSHATMLQKQGLPQPQMAQDARNSTQNAPQQDNGIKANKLPEKSDNGDFEQKVLEQLNSLKQEVDQLMQEESQEKGEETQENEQEPIK